MDLIYFILEILGWYFFGLIGMFIHLIKKTLAMPQFKNQKLSSLKKYWQNNELSITYSLLTYTALFGMWGFGGLEFFGLQTGIFNGSVIFVSYFSDSIFNKQLSSFEKK